MKFREVARECIGWACGEAAALAAHQVGLGPAEQDMARMAGQLGGRAGFDWITQGLQSPAQQEAPAPEASVASPTSAPAESAPAAEADPHPEEAAAPTPEPAVEESPHEGESAEEDYEYGL